MPEEQPGEQNHKAEDDEGGGRIWRSLRDLIFRQEIEPSLREQLEEAIDEHEHENRDGQAPAQGDLSPLEREMLRNLLHFSENDADDVAVPRADIIALEENSTFEEAISLFSEHGHSRLPVYRETLDEVIGMILLKDVFAILAHDAPHPANLANLIRQPLFVPEKMSALDLLAEMRKTRTHMAIVLDEYSGTEGLVTIEDLVEEIVGEIEDEHDDEPEPMLIALDDGMWEADARIELDELAKGVEPPLAEVDEDVDTLGGLAFVLSGHVPQTGEIVEESNGWRLEILDGDEKRVTRIRLHPPAAEKEK